MIRLTHVTRAYASDRDRVLALDDVSLEIAAHEFVAITGPSGCGKSTLLHLIGGLDTPSSGEVMVDDVRLHTATERELTDYRRRKLGIIFQFFNLLPTMTVEENVALPLLLQKFPRAQADRAAREVIELLGLSARRSRFPHQLSGGEQQRAAIARALVHRPAILLADEPTGNLDSANAAHVAEALQKIASQALTTVVIVTHSAEMAGIASRQIRMQDGRIL